MGFSKAEIFGDLLQAWDGDDYYVLRYWPKSSAEANDTTRLILGFKEDRDEAYRIALQLVVDSVRRSESILGDELGCRKIVSIPSSMKGRINLPCERVCEALAKEFGWLQHLPAALVRNESVPKSAWAAPGERPTTQDHLRTISYGGPKVSLKDMSVIMFDDIITRKATSSACRQILQASTSCQRVIGLFLGRTS